MKAALLTGLRQIGVFDTPAPDLARDDDVLLRMERVGVCGSDVHYFAHGRIGRQIVSFPYCIGHEGSASVVRVGHAVTRVKAGDRVAIEPARSCGACDQCQAGRPHTCRRLLFLGTPGQGPGCLSEFIVMPQECCFPVAPATDADRAALIEPLSIALYAVRLPGLPLAGKRCAILGCGPIGLSVLLALQAHGSDDVAMTDIRDYRLAVARQAGAGWTARADAGDPAAALEERDPLGMDIVWECCGQQAALDQAVLMLKPGGTLVVVGIPEEERVSLPLDEMRRREIRLLNVRRQNGCVQDALDLIEQRGVNPDFLITHRFPLDQVQTAFETAHAYADGIVKAMIVFPAD